MVDDPVVQILREAAARGRELRLAREQAAQNETRSDNVAAEERLSNPTVGVIMSLQYDDDGVKENAK